MSVITKIKVGSTGDIAALVDNTTDYTAFEVYAHNEDIPLGYSEELGGEIKKVIPACMEHRFDIKTTVLDTAESDVVIVWGDGETSSVAEGEFLSTALNEEDGELNIQFSHVYKDPGKYIVRILGRKYYTFNWPDAATGEERYHYNLLCRIFDTDLPICSCVTNLASAGSYARRLKRVRIPSYYNFSNVSNFSYLFYASGVESVMGLKNVIGVCATDSNMFDNCTSLKETDFMFPVLATRGSWAKMFSKCWELTTPVSSMFFAGALPAGQINVNNLFNGCSKLPTEDLGYLFWNRSNVSWVNTATAFTGCSAELRALVPTSWGGTNEAIDKQLKVKKLIKEGKYDPTDYTAFEVLAHDYAIEAGTNSTDLGDIVNYEIPASREMQFLVRSPLIADEVSDVIIDWGDGDFSIIADKEYLAKEIIEDENEVNYTVGHEYSTNGKYIVKILGRDYFSFRTIYKGAANLDADDPSPYTNLICRVFDHDLPLASHLCNLANSFTASLRLLNVNIPPYYNTNNITNTASTFKHCKNLITAKGFKRQFVNSLIPSEFFFKCSSLTSTDFTLPQSLMSGRILGIFSDCTSLNIKVSDIFPEGDNLTGSLAVGRLFYNCGENLDLTDCDKLLWNNPKIEYRDTSNAFKKCSSNITSQVPVSWGGTLPDTEIEKSYDVRIQELEARIAELESKLSQAQNA